MAECTRQGNSGEPISWQGGRIILSKQEHAFWIQKFKNAELLELALISAVGDVPPNPRGITTYVARVRAYLARLCMGKIERDGRAKSWGNGNGYSKPAMPNLANFKPPADGSKCYREGSSGFYAILRRLDRDDPDEARAVRRRGFVWVSHAEPN
jgi:hypothetical protein